MGYSLDFRKRVLAYKDKHSLTFEQTSAHFEISIRTLFRWSHKIEPCMTRDKPPMKIPDEVLIADVQNFPDDYQWERAKRLGVSQSAIHYALKRLRLTHKKNLKTSSR
ncbi:MULTISPECIES: IS630 transposase-related protein [Xenorhabdus]|uniref:IS630 transposase-related protein n=1 Tax=Xenorhabdus TaxID=626 RepID=UPI0025581B3D|nr:IS630 transposase-related protein [Xenorhabdus sp. SF857]WFQ78192.1 IS630 transposase-related protein [Xenorhabdus sp. SF857]WFQ78447.1 IS630 transposase-related protein [Xenorhabdus sp. SF857]WFQ79258.1 IS630 transposase-related protein [Xenorhabdus sp. SF857]WFQ79370.1 IS630 transposase-related protein [Xenorhabdus sp. SF857]WFQ79653.1 IS630 transposase-related protein [Xenorhabdus sp. SF857]